MTTDRYPLIPEVGPREAWNILSEDKRSVLVDVRTRPEWTFVGWSDLSAIGKETIHVEWKSWPDLTPNPAFVGALLEEVGELPSRFLFICRSGARSMQAAQAVAEALTARGESVPCINVAEGFEGDLNNLAHRGGLNGWKAHGLAWCQS
ncbi:Rhodanese-related sulfurtransferase [Jannaschia faecimaris]|uniref:Rhodanese-related sulfurtransferase n=1 Tax=Jannaschia faecimaris TaxID=1244108 RepID=A0A1H3Q0M4_9RHOB|nr:rhodanese-like domain-containing protein [Jannaschia faecimaris]SDZ06575.1 Rhodanese-related sulfurtransferase [Jannaschia faecimaris]